MAGFIGSNGNNLENDYVSNMDFIDRYTRAQLWSWGRNNNGQLGLAYGDFSNKRVPERVIYRGNNKPYIPGSSSGYTAVYPEEELDWKKISICRGATYALRQKPLYTGARLLTWTTNPFTTDLYTSVEQVVDISGGADHMVILSSNAALLSRGNNTYGQLGTGDTVHRYLPSITITGNTSWKSFSCGSNNTLAIKTDGTLWAWGDNTYGQLGDGTATHKSSPVQNILAGNTWSKISSGDSHALAIKTDGTLWAWGINDFGQLGDSTVIAKSSPVQIPGTTWKTVIAGVKHSAAIKNDGTLWLWGANSGDYGGLLGDNTSTHKSSPVQIISGGNWKQVACGNTHNLGIKTDGTVWSWGSDTYGELGTFTSTFTAKSSPVQVKLVGDGTLTGYWKQVACGDNFSMMIGFDAYG